MSRNRCVSHVMGTNELSYNIMRWFILIACRWLCHQTWVNEFLHYIRAPGPKFILVEEEKQKRASNKNGEDHQLLCHPPPSLIGFHRYILFTRLISSFIISNNFLENDPYVWLIEKGEAQAPGCEWECKHLPNFKCWMGDVGHDLCHSFCTNEGAITGVCVSNPHRCLCRKAGCS